MNCYNGEEFLHEALESVQSQTHKNWELIFWDNQSKDSSCKIFKSFNDNRLKYHYSSEHTSLYKARNLAIEKCKGEFISFIDSDDWWVPEKLETQIEFFKDQIVGMVSILQKYHPCHKSYHLGYPMCFHHPNSYKFYIPQNQNIQ